MVKFLYSRPKEEDSGLMSKKRNGKAARPTNQKAGGGPADSYWGVSSTREKIFLAWDSISQSESTVLDPERITEAVTRITGGTGKYKGIRGLMRDTVQFDTDPASGYSRSATKGEYWFQD